MLVEAQLMVLLGGAAAIFDDPLCIVTGFPNFIPGRKIMKVSPGKTTDPPVQPQCSGRVGKCLKGFQE